MKRILVDVDGVLADFSTGFLSIANRFAGTHHTHDDVRHWDLDKLSGISEHSARTWAEVGKPGFARGLNMYPGARAGMQLLAQDHDIWVVTAPLWMHEEIREPLHGMTFCYDRIRWLEENFHIPRKRVLFAYHKHLVDGDVLIDDKPSNVLEWVAERKRQSGNPRAILWAQPYNADVEPAPNVLRTNDWEAARWFIQH